MQISEENLYFPEHTTHKTINIHEFVHIYIVYAYTKNRASVNMHKCRNKKQYLVEMLHKD